MNALDHVLSRMEVGELRKLAVGVMAVAVLVLSLPAFGVVCVKPDGSDKLSGDSWDTAKATIQAGINAAAAKGGDDVWIKAGSYGGGLTLKNWVNLYGGFVGYGDYREPGAYPTVIDGKRSLQAIKLTARATSVVDGLQIANCSGQYGGGIYCSSASLTVNNVLFSGNRATVSGGAVYAAGSTLVITGSTFANNQSASYGGAVYTSRTTVTVTGSTFTGNSAHYGGAFHCSAAIDSLFEYNTVSGNHADYGGGLSSISKSVLQVLSSVFVSNTARYGGAIYYYYTDSLQSSNLIKGNSATSRGGGIFWANNAFADSVNDTLIGNSADQGGGVCALTKTTGWVTNDIFYDNNARQGGAAYKDSGTTLAMYCCCWERDGAAPFTGGVYPDPVYDNIQADPGFVDYAGGDYHITPFSPCVDAGDSWYVEYHTDWRDLDGNWRIVGTWVDIGCYELQ